MALLRGRFVAHTICTISGLTVPAVLELRVHTSGTERIVTVLKAVAHPLRLGILAILSDGEEHVTGLAERLRVSRSAVSGALSLMRMVHIVAVDRRDGHATYRLQDERLRDLISWTRRPHVVGCGNKRSRVAAR